ncbi:MAG: lamin tail domain-containing protein [Bacteroidales bacterium]|nr:lamin tail domain-containing protein [Bacteroidales bacterium]
MILRLLGLLLLAILSLPSFSQLVINEVQTSNKSTLEDMDGDQNDWIEIYNKGNSNVQLFGYGLSDDPADKFKWQLPDISISAGNVLLVQASGKNRKPLINHFESPVIAENSWRFFVASSSPASNWNTPAYNDLGWQMGTGGIGYGDDDDGTIIPSTVTVYMRKSFNILDTSMIMDAIFNMDYDDGFVAYLNGVEIARVNMDGYPPAYNQLATASHEAVMYQGGLPDQFEISRELLHAIIANGNNVLAIETHNNDAASSDLSSIPYLTFGIRNTNHFYQPVPIWFTSPLEGGLHTNFKLKHSGETIYLTKPDGVVADTFAIPYSDLNHSFCRIPDGASSWCITNTPSPEQSNNTSSCFTGYAEKPIINQAPGYYSSSGLLVSITPPSGGVVHYTTNGNVPTALDPIYTQPFYLGTTRVVKARCFGPGNVLPGKVATSTFIIGSHNFNMPVISLSMDSLDLWDYETGIYVMGPGATTDFPYFGANFWLPWEKDCHFEFFEPMKHREFELDAGIAIHGGWSRAFEQKSFNIKTHSYYDSSNIHYRLFGDKPIYDFESLILRNSGNDWMNTFMRDALMQRSMKDSYVDYMAYAPSAVFLNGNYWGMYNIRERNSKDFMASNHGVNADSLDVISNDGIVSQGTDISFWEMANYISTHEMSNPDNFTLASSMWDMKNFTDYFITETYYVNNDWIGYWTNNIKLWRERKVGGKWSYILMDMDFGLGLSSNYWDDKIYSALYPSVATPHSDIFRNFLDNSGYRNYFINRYADLINTTFQYSNLQPMLEQMRDSIAPEIPNVWQRWYGYSTQDEWLSNLNYVTTFITNRPSYARQYINNNFALGGQNEIKLSVLPAGAGYIKINTIIPPQLPWVGTYFEGNPITITAVPAPGFTFQYWAPNTFISSDTSRSLTIDLSHYDVFKAVFYGSPVEPNIIFSEVNYHSDSTMNSGDWIELHNTTDVALDLTDWHLTDSHFYNNFMFNTRTVIPANGYLVIAENPELFHQQYPSVSCVGPLGFGLNNKGETLTLLNFRKDTISSFSFTDEPDWLQTCNGFGRTMELKAVSSDPNDPASWYAGCMGGSPGEGYQPCNELVSISEINYNSADWADAGDWIELRNPGSTAVDLTGWKFLDSDDTHNFTISAGTSIQPGAFLVLYGDEGKFPPAFGWVSNRLGPFDFGLSGSGELLRLYDQNGKIRFSMAYDDDTPWPTEADGSGYTLEALDASGIMNDGLNWFAGCLQGSPGGTFVTPCHTGSEEAMPSEMDCRVYPNPADEYLEIILKESGVKGKLELRDALGHCQLSKDFENNAGSRIRIEVGNLASGIYFLHISGNESLKPIDLKVVISH